MCRCWNIDEAAETKVSDNMFDRVQEQIRNKIAQKSKGSERVAAIKVFKFFDLDERCVWHLLEVTAARICISYGKCCSGKVNQDEFKYALERLGVVMSDADMRGVFRRVDISNSGNVSYEEFVRSLYPAQAIETEEKSIEVL